MKSFVLIVIVNHLALFGGEQILHYSPYGVNWNKASLSCGINGLEIMEEVLRRSDVFENQQFWIGKTSIFTPWIELIGCYEVHGLNKTELSSLNTRGECQKKCQHVKHFGFKKTSSRRCVCIPDEVLIDNQKNMSACEESYSYYVYKEFLGTVVDSDDPGNCMTLCCGRNCNAKDLTTVARCDCTTTPLLCLAGVINTVDGEKIFKKIEKACNESLQWFICNSHRSPKTDQALYRTMSSSGMTPKQIIENQGNTETTLVKGAVIGGSVGLNLLCFGVILLVRKLRKTGLLKDTGHYADLKMENQNTCHNDVYFTVID